MKQLFIFLWITLVGNALAAQDIGVSGVFIPNPIPVGATSTLSIIFNNNSFTENIIPQGATISVEFPANNIYSNSTPPTGDHAANFDWIKTGNIWEGTFNSTLGPFSVQRIEFVVTGNAVTGSSALATKLLVALTPQNGGSGDPSTGNNEANPDLVVTIAPMPVELTSFNGKLLDCDQVNLYWVVAQEVNNKGFDVERSFDGNSFKAIASIDGSGNSSVIKQYSYIDHDLGASSYKDVYYRLKQTDFDGKVNYPGEIIALKNKCADHLIVSLSPNPARDKTFIAFSGYDDSKEVAIKIFDANGRLVGKYTSDMSTNFEINAAELKPGVYSIFIESDGFKESKRLIVIE